jgi:hypothetical protein
MIWDLGVINTASQKICGHISDLEPYLVSNYLQVSVTNHMPADIICFAFSSKESPVQKLCII